MAPLGRDELAGVALGESSGAIDTRNTALRAPALIGRQRELALLVEAARTPPSVVIIEGEAGIDKTQIGSTIKLTITSLRPHTAYYYAIAALDTRHRPTRPALAHDQGKDRLITARRVDLSGGRDRCCDRQTSRL